MIDDASLYLYGEMLVAVLISILCFLTCVWWKSRKYRVVDILNVNSIAEGLLRDCGRHERWRWISADTIQFVTTIVTTVAGRHLIWARVTMKKTRIFVTIECSYLVDDSGSAYAHRLVEALKRKGVFASLLHSAPQPRENEVRALLV